MEGDWKTMPPLAQDGPDWVYQLVETDETKLEVCFDEYSDYFNKHGEPATFKRYEIHFPEDGVVEFSGNCSLDSFKEKYKRLIVAILEEELNISFEISDSQTPATCPSCGLPAFDTDNRARSTVDFTMGCFDGDGTAYYHDQPKSAIREAKREKFAAEA
jgi:hypothetical protein